MARGQSAIVAHVVRAIPLIEQSEKDEQPGADQRLVEDLICAAIQTRKREGEDAKNDEAVGAECSERGELLEIGLYQRKQRAVDDADSSKGDQQGSDIVRLLRKDSE